MSKKSSAQRAAASRSDARRRARLIAQGRVPEEDEEQVAAAPTRAPSLSLFQRIFPPAPPLPGKPDPLAGFTYGGPLRPLAVAGWLIRRNLFAGVGMGVLWAAAYVLTVQYGQSLVGTLASFVAFGALVAAGWLGWQKPWLYGLVAAVIGYALYASYLAFSLTSAPAILETLRNVPFGYLLVGRADPAAGVTFFVTNGAIQTGIGAVAGFYGGYLRRRIADPATRQAAAARRRR
jgi:hypothetical protein